MYIGFSSSVLGPEGYDQLRTGERKLTDPDVVAAAQLLLDLQPFYQAGFQATDYVTAKAIFANAQGRCRWPARPTSVAIVRSTRRPISVSSPGRVRSGQVRD